jgi:hypothetical protein
LLQKLAFLRLLLYSINFNAPGIATGTTVTSVTPIGHKQARVDYFYVSSNILNFLCVPKWESIIIANGK